MANVPASRPDTSSVASTWAESCVAGRGSEQIGLCGHLLEGTPVERHDFDRVRPVRSEQIRRSGEAVMQRHVGGSREHTGSSDLTAHSDSVQAAFCLSLPPETLDGRRQIVAAIIEGFPADASGFVLPHQMGQRKAFSCCPMKESNEAARLEEGVGWTL